MSTGMIDRAMIERIVRQVVYSQADANQPVATATCADELVVSISARHCHLTDEHVEMLFGPGATLTPQKSLYQENG